MVDIKDLAPGMKVKIINEWCEPHRENGEGRMDKWLGETVTIKRFYGEYAFIEEDHEQWGWFPEMFECMVDPSIEEDLAAIDMDTFLKFV